MRRASATDRMFPSCLGWVMSVMLLLLSGSTRAQDLQGCDNAGRTFMINMATGAGTYLCSLPTSPDPGATEIEYDPISQTGFVQARDGVFSGQRFNISNCAAIGGLVPTGGLAFNGLEFIGGVLYGAGIANTCDPSVLAVIDPLSGISSVIGPTGVGPISGLAWDPGTQTLFGVTGCSQQGASQLVSLDLATGAATIIGPTGRTLGSLEFSSNGFLYAGGDTRDGGNLYVIDPATGSTTMVGPTGFANVTGLALVTQPVPVFVTGFTAKPIVGGVHLGWKVFSDEVVIGFRIYRSNAGVDAMVSLADMLPPSSRTYTDKSVDGDQSYDYMLVVVLTDHEVASPVETVHVTPFSVTLDQNSPNPFNPATTIAFTLGQRADAVLSIYDVRGNLVRTLLDRTLDEGRHEYVWDGKNSGGTAMSSGVYFYRLSSGKQTLTKKMVLLK